MSQQLEALSDIMRWADAYAFDYAQHGKLAWSRAELEKALRAQVERLQAERGQVVGCGRCEDNAKPCDITGGPCADVSIEDQLKDALQSLDFYKRRCDLLQDWQSKMRDPERTIVCDILANGQTLPPEHAGDRYTSPPPVAQAGGADERAQIESIARAHGTGGWQTLDDMVRFGLAVRAALAAQPARATCGGPGGAHRFTHFGDQTARRCADCSAVEAAGVTLGDAGAENHKVLCKTCGADRLKEPCAGYANNCPIQGTAQ